MKIALLMFGLMVISVVSGCTTTEYVPVQPQCTPPPQPILPAVDRGELWDKMGDAEYRVIERYIDGIWAYADEQAAMLNALCGKDEHQPTGGDRP